MTISRIPREYWDWRCSSLVLLVAAAPFLSLMTLTPDRFRSVESIATFDAIALAPAELVAAVCVYVAWRISARRTLAWLSVATAVVSLEDIATAGLQLAAPQMVVGHAFWMAFSDVLLLSVVLMVTASFARRFSGEPAVIGIMIGLGLGLVRLGAVARFPAVDIHAYGPWPIVLGYVVFVGSPAWLLAREGNLEAWARWRLALAVWLYGSGHLASYLGHHSALGYVGRQLGDCGGSLMLTSVAVALLRKAILDQRAGQDDLIGRLGEAEGDRRRDRAQIHELASSIAGVLSANRLLREDDSIGPERRRLLGNMIHEELCRLDRLLTAPVAAPRPRTVDLDSTIGALALAHQVRGRQVSWRPSGASVMAHPDDVVEVLNILLENAARHGAADADVRVESGDDGVRILVSDSGPGIPQEMRERLFEWGARGPDSPGQGIGLSIAEELAQRQGGYLRLQEDAASLVRGTTFVIGLPTAHAHGHQPHVA